MNYDNHYTDMGTGNAQAETEATSGGQTSRENPIPRVQLAPIVHRPADPF